MRRAGGRGGRRALVTTGVALGTAVALATTSCGSEPAQPPAPPPPTATDAGTVGPLPKVSPTPVDMVRLGDDVAVRGTIEIVADDAVDQSTRDLVTQTLRDAGATDVSVRAPGAAAVPGASLSVRIGALHTPDVRRAITDAGTQVPEKLPPEGYALAVKGSNEGSTVALGGADGDGIYYAAQTLRQLVSPGRIAGAGVVDHPSMGYRGAIEGFYGPPWSHADRMNQLAFYGDTKMNTYIYSPKDDPYLRDRWRQPYPADRAAKIGDLVNQAKAHHVNFTYALSPGPSICYSDQDDYRALTAKLQSVYDLGVRHFYIPMDDIQYTKWNCSADKDKYGPPSKQTAGKAQVDLLNRVEQDFIAHHPDVAPLETVPTEYHDLDDSPYKKVWREGLDKRIKLMVTGDGVVPDGVTVQDAQKAKQLWGRKPILWDNYPVNDFKGAVGRIMLGSYSERQKGLDKPLNGVAVNPMNQASASKIVEFGAADFSWNNKAFDARKSWRAAVHYLAGGDSHVEKTLMAFADLNHLAPLANGKPWLPQAPLLNRRLVDFQSTWEGGDQQKALDQLRPYAQRLANAPETLRVGGPKKFVDEVGPWLKATGLWGRALEATLDGLQAKSHQDQQGAQRHFAKSRRLVRKAQKIRSSPDEVRRPGPVKVGDGVLDTFLENAPNLR